MPPIRPGQKSQTQKPENSANNNKTIIILVAALIICIAGGYFLYPIIKKTLSKRPVTEIIPDTPAIDTIPKVVEKKVIVEEIPHKQESSSSVPKGFYIIVGSYQKKYNADNLVKKSKKDIELNVLFFEELGLYRVSAGHYDNIHKAYNDTYSIKDLDGCANAWVLENQ